jgi:hypothetical protein
MYARMLLVFLSAWLAWLHAAPSRAQSRTSLSFGAEYTSGDYGTGTSTDVLYLPVIARLWSGANLFEVTVPYIRITGPSGGTVVGVDHMGRPIQGGKGSKLTTESGLGDIEAGYGRTLRDDLESGTRVNALFKVKLGTADETRLLGTGENDYWAELDAFQSVGALTWLGAIGYRVYGDPPGVNLRDIWFGSLGVSTRYGEAGSLGVVYNFGQPITSTGDSQRELRLYYRGQTAKDWHLLAYLLAGSGNASPDRGFGLLLTRSY